MSRITGLSTADVRFPTSLMLDGSDAMNPDPDYSAAYVRLDTDADDGHTGHGFVFTIGRGPASELLLRRAGPRLAGLAAGFRADAFGYIAFLRLLPIFPFWMTNLAPAAFGVKRSTFVLATLFGLLPGVFVYASTGAAIEDVVLAHESAKAACLAAGGLDCDNALTLRALVTPKMMAGLAALAAFALLSVFLRRRFQRRNAASH